MYTEAQPESKDSDEAQYEETMQAIDLIKGSISHIDFAKTSLQALIDKLKDTYDNTKNKDEKKALLQEIEHIDQEIHFIGEAVELQFMLGTRLTETSSNQRKIERKLGISKKAQNVNSFFTNSQSRSDDTPFAIQFDDETEANSGTASTVRPIPPRRVNLLLFSGNEEEFPEFWAIFETLVHENPALTVIEKMLLLEEGLQGKSDRSVRGIQLLPQNYEWMIRILHKNTETGQPIELV
nr:hypothetical protein HCOI_00098500 [Haemonchus contortus]